MLINFLKNNLFVQNFASWLMSRLSPMIEHNLGKYMALKKAFYLTGLEKLDGDYLEFGVFTGSSFVYATRIHRKLKFLGDVKTAFFGFDSFVGFGRVENHDEHPFYQDTTFTVNQNKVTRNILKKSGSASRQTEVKLIDGYFEKTLPGKMPSDYGIGKVRILFIDCDLKDPARLALDFAYSSMQEGMILIMDDYYSFKGSETKGVTGAFHEFNAAHPELKWRRVYDYGYGGIVFILSSVKA